METIKGDELKSQTSKDMLLVPVQSKIQPVKSQTLIDDMNKSLI
jgi:hypothetical protein